MQIPVLLDRTRQETLTAQLADQLRDAVRKGWIGSGQRLPSSRTLSIQLEISRNTVVRAYETLLMEGYVDARPASGMFAAAELPEQRVKPNRDAAEATELAPSNMPAPPQVMRAQSLVGQNRNRLSLDFFPGRPSAAQFPLKTWRRLINVCLARGGAAGLAHYSDPAGLANLRAAIANHLAATRAIVTDPSRIVIVGGTQEGIHIASSLLVAPGALCAVEDPGYQGAAFAFEACGAELIGAPIDEMGLIVDELPERPVSLLHLTPSHQYPTGHTLSVARRHALVSWARRNGCYILEDDYDGDFRYEGSPLQAIAAMAPDCTIYLGTVSKSLGAGLRLGYMVLPSHLAAAARSAKTLLNNGNSWLEQAALAEMMRSGSFAAHLTRTRGAYKEARDTLLASLNRHFGDVAISGEAAGLHVFWHLPPGVPDADILENIARRARVGLYTIASGGAHAIRHSPLTRRGIILGYAALTPRQIEQGIARLSDAIDEALDGKTLNVNDVLVPLSARARPRPATATRPSRLALRFRQQPALGAHALPRASSRRIVMQESSVPMPIISGIYRYPIKGLSPQALSRVTLAAGKPLPHDRIFAFARPGAPIDPDDPQWGKKGLFVMLMLDEGLAQVRTHLDVETLILTVTRGNDSVMSADLNDASACTALEAFIQQLVPKLPAPPALVRSRNGHFMDKPDNVVSLINLATIRSLEAQWGFEIDPLRFRAHFYIDGGRPWEEFDWVGSRIKLGGMSFLVDRRNGRCSATNVNPANGQRDLDIPGSLRAAFGHKDLGIYLIAQENGQVTVGDAVETPGVAAAPRGEAVTVPRMAAGSQHRLICGGCYFIYEEAKGLPLQGIAAGTPFSELPATWRCPDCGTEKANFRPHVAQVARKG